MTDMRIKWIAKFLSESIFFIIYIKGPLTVRDTNKKHHHKGNMVRFSHSFLPLSFGKWHGARLQQ